MSLLEVVALTEADADAAEAGGAGRVEIVADVQAGGLSLDPRMVAGMLLRRAAAHAALVRRWRALVDASPCPRAPADPE
jgi:copper homeostasis protein CutC